MKETIGINMQKKILINSIAIMLIIFLDCSKKNVQTLPSVGEKIPDGAVYMNKTFCTPDGRDTLYLHKFQFNGILYFLEGDKNRKMVLMFTGDSNFVTPEGVRIGDNALKVEKMGVKIRNSPKFCEYELPSKWIVFLRKVDTVKIGNITSYSNNPSKMKVITFRKY
jgi:hypothetical protein